MLILSQSLTLGSELGLKRSRERDVNRGNQVGIKIDIQAREYNLNYQFKYLKSMVESGSILITVST